MIRSLEHKKEHSTVKVSTGEIRKGYETFRDGHYALVPCLDGTVSLLKTAVLKTLLHRENVRTRAEAVVPCGETVVLLPSAADAEKLLHSFDALTNKLDRIADRIITEYRPIDLKWSRLQEEQMSGLRVIHWIFQSLVAGAIFAVITYLFVTNPQAVVPIFFTGQPDAPFRSFIASYLLMLPALCVFFNYVVVYMIWFKSMEAGVRNRTRKAVDRDMNQLRHSIESEL
jgi:hypothetical protein